MAVIDTRKKSEAEQSFYVFDDLRYQQNSSRPDRPSFDIYRFDSLAEAIMKFREIPDDMTPALGMHISERAELDLIHRREGDTVLVTDYLQFPDWRTNYNVISAVNELCEALNIEWQLNSKLIPGGTILIPLEKNFERVPDKVFDNKNLAAKAPLFPSKDPNPLTAINEAYVEGRGWLPFADVFKKAESFGYNNPKLLKIAQFNIKYKDNRGYLGQSDISPFDLQILKERHDIHYGPESARDAALQKLAEELDEFAENFDYYDYHDGIEDKEEHIKSLKDAFSEGNVYEIVSFLRGIEEENAADNDIVCALRLASRIQGLAAQERKPGLDSKINEAAEKAQLGDLSEQHKQNSEAIRKTMDFIMD